MITDEHGRRRLDDPHDLIRLEIEAALTRNLRVIPILVDEARMPTAEELPGQPDELVRRWWPWSSARPGSNTTPSHLLKSN